MFDRRIPRYVAVVTNGVSIIPTLICLHPCADRTVQRTQADAPNFSYNAFSQSNGLPGQPLSSNEQDRLSKTINPALILGDSQVVQVF